MLARENSLSIYKCARADDAPLIENHDHSRSRISKGWRAEKTKSEGYGSEDNNNQEKDLRETNWWERCFHTQKGILFSDKNKQEMLNVDNKNF